MKENLRHGSLHSVSLFLKEEKKVQEAQTKSLLFDQFSIRKNMKPLKKMKKKKEREREPHTHKCMVRC